MVKVGNKMRKWHLQLEFEQARAFMPPKRKATSDMAQSPRKRQTRSSPRREHVASSSIPQSDEDELNENLTPRKQPGTPTRSKPAVMACVEIITPSRKGTRAKNPITFGTSDLNDEQSPFLDRDKPTAKRSKSLSPVKKKATKKQTKALEVLQTDEDVPMDIDPSPTRVIPVSPTKAQLGPATPSKKKARVLTFDTGDEASQNEDELFQRLQFAPPASPTRKGTVPPTPSRHARNIPAEYISCIGAQKRAVLRALQNPPEVNTLEEERDEELGPPPSHVVYEQLNLLLQGTITRAESNSCLIVGPPGSGKSRIVGRCLSNLTQKPIVIHLSGWAQHSDILAMREIARQLTLQTGSSVVSEEQLAEQEDPFIDNTEQGGKNDEHVHHLSSSVLPPAAFLSQLINSLPSLARPTVVVLDAIDLFALHPRQSLLYCLLDTVQASRPGNGNKGLIVIGLTTRVDTLDLFEKRVKSRFSGRIMRTAPHRKIGAWLKVARAMLCARLDVEEFGWQDIWEQRVDAFLSDKQVSQALRETFSLSRDIRLLCRLLMYPILKMSPSTPSLNPAHLLSACETQRVRQRTPVIRTLSYPCICLLIASMHLITAGQDTYTFAMLSSNFQSAVQLSLAAPVQLNGGSIGMQNCTRDVLLCALEELVNMRYLVLVTPNVKVEFGKYTCTLEREEVRLAVESMGQTNLKKWLNKAQT